MYFQYALKKRSHHPDLPSLYSKQLPSERQGNGEMTHIKNSSLGEGVKVLFWIFKHT